MKACIISGSPQANSNTLRFSKALKHILDEQHIPTSIVHFEQYDIPFIHQGELSEATFTPFQKELYEKVSEAQLVFICSPEYNWMPSAELINMLHQIGSKTFKPFFNNKVFAVAGVSTGRGGKMPCIQLNYVLNKLINHLDCDSTVSSRNFESHYTHKELDEAGHKLGNEMYDKGIRAFVDFALRTAVRWHK